MTCLRAFLFLLLCSTALARIVHESEPNDFFDDANDIECGDTVQCANLGLLQPDFYRLVIPGGHSVYITSFPCQADVEFDHCTL